LKSRDRIQVLQKQANIAKMAEDELLKSPSKQVPSSVQVKN
jgi:hypothetical protein